MAYWSFLKEKFFPSFAVLHVFVFPSISSLGFFSCYSLFSSWTVSITPLDFANHWRTLIAPTLIFLYVYPPTYRIPIFTFLQPCPIYPTYLANNMTITPAFLSVTDLKSWSSDRTGAWSHISLTPDQYYCLSWLSPTPLAILDLARNEINFYKGNFHKVTLMTVPFLEPYHSSLTHTHTHTHTTCCLSSVYGTRAMSTPCVLNFSEWTVHFT